MLFNFHMLLDRGIYIVFRYKSFVVLILNTLKVFPDFWLLWFRGLINTSEVVIDNINDIFGRRDCVILGIFGVCNGLLKLSNYFCFFCELICFRSLGFNRKLRSLLDNFYIWILRKLLMPLVLFAHRNFSRLDLWFWELSRFFCSGVIFHWFCINIFLQLLNIKSRDRNNSSWSNCNRRIIQLGSTLILLWWF